MTHPDRRRKGRAIRKRNRKLRQYSAYVTAAAAAFDQMGRALAIPTLALNSFSIAVGKLGEAEENRAKLIEAGNAEHARIAQQFGIVEP